MTTASLLNSRLPTPDSGFTLLELLLVIGLLAILLAMGVPAFDGWQDRRGFENSYRDLKNQLTEAKLEALKRNTTVRLSLTDNGGGSYTLTRLIAATPTFACDGTGVWTNDQSVTLMFAEPLALESAPANLCFFRDGTASNGQYLLSETGSTRSATLTVTMATGFVDEEVVQ